MGERGGGSLPHRRQRAVQQKLQRVIDVKLYHAVHCLIVCLSDDKRGSARARAFLILMVRDTSSCLHSATVSGRGIIGHAEGAR